MSTNFEDLIGRGNTASKPAAAIPGRLYYDTDESKLYRDNGATWDEAEGGGVSYGVIGVVLDGGGSAISTGIKVDLPIPYNCTITSAELVADQSGSIVIDIWKDTYANFPPTDADSITASAPPTLSSVQKSQDGTLTGWTTSLTKGQWLRFNVDSAATVTRATLVLYVTKT